MSSQPTLSYLLAVARQVYPALSGQLNIERRTGIQMGEDNLLLLNALYRHWQQAHPEAGDPYWTVRSWTFLIWQPIYLTVIAVHGTHLLPVLKNMRQHLNQGVVAGFDMVSDSVRCGNEQVLLTMGADTLRELCSQLMEDFNHVSRIKPTNAWRLVADTVVSAVTLVDQLKPDVTNDQISSLADEWLFAMGLKDQSALMPVPLTNGQEKLGLNRKTCCLYYLRHDGELCSTCPKVKMPERLKKLRKEFEQHV